MTQKRQLGKPLLRALYASIAVAILVIAMLAVSFKKPAQMQVFLGGKGIAVAVADTPALRNRGLSGRKELKENEGMLFNFPEPGLYGFWMKDMYFPIDVIWFDANRQIIDVWENATPDSFPQTYTPHSFAQFVLEVPAGFFSSHHLKVGNILGIPK